MHTNVLGATTVSQPRCSGDSRSTLGRFRRAWRFGELLSAMALSAGRIVVARSTGVVGGEKQRHVTPPAQLYVSVSGNSRIAAPLQRCRLVAPIGRRQLHAIATNSGVLELEEEREALELRPESEVSEVDKESEEEDTAPSGPSAHEIHNLLMQICDETSSIAEVELKVGTFSLRVRREIGKASKPVLIGKAMVDRSPVPSANPSKSTKLAKSSTPSKAAPADGGLLFVASPKVGLFRQGRTVKGKSGPPLCAEGQVVKKGQVVCYLEQLGTQQSVEADIDGEVEKVLCKDGELVGYGDRLIAIRP